jgi:hypothetical protein
MVTVNNRSKVMYEVKARQSLCEAHAGKRSWGEVNAIPETNIVCHELKAAQVIWDALQLNGYVMLSERPWA